MSSARRFTRQKFAVTRDPSNPHIETGHCPWCRRVVVLDSARNVSSHQAPVCGGWNALMARARRELGDGAAREIAPELLPYGDDADPPN